MSEEGTDTITKDIYGDFEFDLLLFDEASNKIDPKCKYDIYSDGASRGNPGPCGAGMVFYDSAGKEVYRNAITLRHGTNNSAEYYAAIYALKTALNLGIVNAQLYSDSELLVKQFKGVFKVNENLKPYHMEMCRLSEKFDRVTVEGIPNPLNKTADSLAKQAIQEGIIEEEKLPTHPEAHKESGSDR